MDTSKYKFLDNNIDILNGLCPFKIYDAKYKNVGIIKSFVDNRDAFLKAAAKHSKKVKTSAIMPQVMALDSNKIYVSLSKFTQKFSLNPTSGFRNSFFVRDVRDSTFKKLDSLIPLTIIRGIEKFSTLITPEKESNVYDKADQATKDDSSDAEDETTEEEVEEEENNEIMTRSKKRKEILAKSKSTTKKQKKKENSSNSSAISESSSISNKPLTPTEELVKDVCKKATEAKMDPNTLTKVCEFLITNELSVFTLRMVGENGFIEFLKKHGIPQVGWQLILQNIVFGSN